MQHEWLEVGVRVRVHWTTAGTRRAGGGRRGGSYTHASIFSLIGAYIDKHTRAISLPGSQ